MNSWVRRTPTIEEEMKWLPLSIFCTMPCQSFGNRMALSIAYDYRGQEEMKTWWTWDLEENACSLNVFVRNRSPVLVHAIPWLWATNNESLINEKKVPRAIFLLRRFHPVVSERHIFFIISNTQIPPPTRPADLRKVQMVLHSVNFQVIYTCRKGICDEEFMSGELIK